MSYYSFYKLLKTKSSVHLITLGTCLAIFTMFHASSFFLLITYILLLVPFLLNKNVKLSVRHISIATLIFLTLSVFPYYLQEKMTDFYNLNIFKDYFIDKDSAKYIQYSSIKSSLNYINAINTALYENFFPVQYCIYLFLNTNWLVIAQKKISYYKNYPTIYSIIWHFN